MRPRTPKRSTIALAAAAAAFFLLAEPLDRSMTTLQAAPQPAQPKSPPAQPQAPESKAEAIDRKQDTLTETLLGRLDEAEKAEAAWQEQKISTALALGPRNEAARLARGSEQALAEYKDKTYPSELHEIDEEIRFYEGELARSTDRLEWSKGMMKNKLLSEAQFGNDKASHIRTELILKQSRSKRETLESITHPRRLGELAGDVERSAEELQVKTLLWDRERLKEAAAERAAREAALNLAESKSLGLLLDSRAVIDRSRRATDPAEKARLIDESAARLREAEAQWSDALAHRAATRRTSVETRLRRAALRDLPPPPPRPDPGRPGP